jgi:dolichol-phosphate mannosyltransferase
MEPQMKIESESPQTPFMTVVVPLYNEELIINAMYRRLTDVLEGAELRYELLLVNDGSRDRTKEMARIICQEDQRVKMISFSRNFGHQIAITAGMDRAIGQVVVLIDSDLQDPPELILEMVEKWKEGYQVVYGTRAKRKGESIFKLTTANLFYRVLKSLTSVDIPTDTGDFRLMDARVVRQIVQMREKARFVRGMVSWVGFRQCKVEYVREKRFAGETKYPLKKMIKFALDGIFSFSNIPLKLASSFGFLCAIISFLMIVFAIFEKIYRPDSTIRGWASIFIAIMFLGGVQLISVGILGEYIGRIYEEAKNRPIYIVDEEINF